MDLGVTNRAGARLGPRAVRAIERIGPFEHVLRRSPVTTMRVADVGDVPFRSRFSLESCHEDIEAFYSDIVDAGVIPLSVGGDHSISYPILKAVGRSRPVGMIHIDAHCDTSGPYEGSKFHHGGPFRQAVLDGVLDPGSHHPDRHPGRRGISLGVQLRQRHDRHPRRGVRRDGAGRRRWPRRARSSATAPTYVSFDVDSLDPGFAPGTGTPEVGGLDAARGAARPARPRGARRRRGRRRRGRATIRRDEQYRPCRGPDDVHDPAPDRYRTPRPARTSRTSKPHL